MSDEKSLSYTPANRLRCAAIGPDSRAPAAEVGDADESHKFARSGISFPSSQARTL